MDLKLLFPLVFFAATISVGAALKCYACAGTASSDCARGRKASTAVQDCASIYRFFGNASTDNYEETCFQFFATDFQPKLFVKGCILVPTSVDPCVYPAKSRHSGGCKSCKTDLCNKRWQNSENNVSQNNTVV